MTLTAINKTNGKIYSDFYTFPLPGRTNGRESSPINAN